MSSPNPDDEIEIIRRILNNVGLSLVSDTVIEEQYTTCQTYVNLRQVPGTDQSLINIAVRHWCAYLSAVSYYARVSRELATLPVANETILEELRRIAMGFLRSVLPNDDDIFQEEGTNVPEPVKMSHAGLTRTFAQIDHDEFGA